MTEGLTRQKHINVSSESRKEKVQFNVDLVMIHLWEELNTIEIIEENNINFYFSQQNSQARKIINFIVT